MRTSTPGSGSPTDPEVSPVVAHGHGRRPHRTRSSRSRTGRRPPASPLRSVRSVAAAIGALPTVTTARLDRSADSKRGEATMSSTMAGTRKADTGRSRSTVAIQTSGSKRGRNHPLNPPRSGPETRSDPLVVAKGEEDRKPRPSQADGTRSVVESPLCRTITTLGSSGRPRGVHDVGHVVRPGRWPPGHDRPMRADRPSAGRRPPRCTPPSRTAARTGSETTSLHRTMDAPASCRIRPSSTGPSRARSGTATPPALWIAEVGHQPLQRLVVADE